MGFLRKRDNGSDARQVIPTDPREELLPKIHDLGREVKSFSSALASMEKHLKEVPNASDYRLLASEISRLQTELERMEAKH